MDSIHPPSALALAGALLSAAQLLRLCAAYARARRRRRLPFDAALLLGGCALRMRRDILATSCADALGSATPFFWWKNTATRLVSASRPRC